MMDELHPRPFVCALSSFPLSIVIRSLLNMHSLNVAGWTTSTKNSEIESERDQCRLEVEEVRVRGLLKDFQVLIKSRTAISSRDI